jgi:hypothetical protein
VIRYALFLKHTKSGEGVLFFRDKDTAVFIRKALFEIRGAKRHLFPADYVGPRAVMQVKDLFLKRRDSVKVRNNRRPYIHVFAPLSGKKAPDIV